MDALDRIIRLGQSASAGFPDWSEDEFVEAMGEAVKRWRWVRSHFKIDYRMVTDVVAGIAPEFALLAGDELRIREVPVPRMRNVSPDLAVAFVKWDRCPLTASHPNPYEPLIRIWEHGGAFSMEHGIWVDFYAADGGVYGVPLIGPNAGPRPTKGHPGRRARAERRAQRRDRRRR